MLLLDQPVDYGRWHGTVVVDFTRAIRQLIHYRMFITPPPPSQDGAGRSLM